LNGIGALTGIDSVGAAVKTIKGALDKDPELEKKVLDIELEQRKLDIEEGNSVRDLYETEVTSDKKFVAYARPGMLWLIFCIVGANFVALPTINAILPLVGKAPLVIIYPELPESVYWLFGSIFGLYTGARSFDKYKKGKNG